MKPKIEQLQEDAINDALAVWKGMTTGEVRVHEVAKDDVDHAALQTHLGITTAFEHRDGGVTVVCEERPQAIFIGFRGATLEPLRVFIITDGNGEERLAQYQRLPHTLLDSFKRRGVTPYLPDVGNNQP